VQSFLSDFTKKFKVSDKPLITFETIGGQKIIKTLNSDLYDVLEDIGQGANNFDEYTNEIMDIIDQIQSIKISFAKKAGKNKVGGKGVFPYWCNSQRQVDGNDLNRYQIFTENQIKLKPDGRKLFNDNCFVYACKQSEIFTRNELAQIKKECGIQRSITTRTIGVILKELGVRLAYYKLHGVDCKSTYSGDKTSQRTLKLCDVEGHWLLYETVKDPSIVGHGRRQLSSLKLIHLLLKNDYMYPMTANDTVMLTNQFSNNRFSIDRLSINKWNQRYYRPFRSICENCKENCSTKEKVHNVNDRYCDQCLEEPKRPKYNKPYMTWFADFETYNKMTKDSNGNDIISLEPYMIAAVPEQEADVFSSRCIRSIHDGDKRKMFDMFLNDIYKNSKGTQEALGGTYIRLYFHYLKFDFCQILSCLDGDINITKMVKKGGTVYNARFSYKCNAYKYKGKHIPGTVVRFDVRCSFLLIGQTLQAASKTYLGEPLKNPCLYRWYDRENFSKSPTEEEIRTFLSPKIMRTSESDIDQFIEFIKTKEPNMFNKITKQIDMWRFYDKYCLNDCKVLSKVFHEFRKLFLELGIEPQKYLTSASLADNYYYDQGALDEVYQLTGIPQYFCQKAVVGGRCMTAWNKSYHVTKKTEDFDACSLYPSAMKWIPTGRAEIIPSTCSEKALKDYKYYIVEVKILKIPKRRPFPILSYVNSDGSRCFSNDMVGMTIITDSVTLEDFREFQDGEYHVIKGYGWKQVSTKIDQVTQTLYDLRKKYKADKNSPMYQVQNLLKLIMNSSYGKNIMKMTDTKSKICNLEKMEQTVYQHYQNIKTIHQLGNYYIVDQYKERNDHWNRPHVGCAILSQSKRIMNRVMCLADDIGVDIYYTDTDSIQVDSEGLPRLIEAYKVKYDAELVGKERGQFHCDFSLGDAKDPYSVEGLYLGKKMYACQLQSDDGTTGHHLVMKGIPNELVKWDHYVKLATGQSVTYDLLEGKAGIRTTNFQSTIPCKFDRTVQASILEMVVRT
jgi:hypothetical protein